LVLLKKLQLGIYLVPIEERLQLTSYWRLDGSIKGTPALYQHLALGIYLLLLGIIEEGLQLTSNWMFAGNIKQTPPWY
jgi:hypothetical protein